MGLSPEEEKAFSGPDGEKKLEEYKRFAQNKKTIDTVTGTALNIIPGIGPLAGLAYSGIQGAVNSDNDKRIADAEAMRKKAQPSPWDEFIAELQKPIDWNSPGTKLLLGEAQGAANRDASNRGLGRSGASVENTQAAVENAKARYDLQRQQLLGNALAAKQAGDQGGANLDFAKQQYAGLQQANADRNAIAIGGGLAQTGQNLFATWQGNNGGLNTGGPGLATPQPMTGASNAGSVPGSYYNAPPLSNEGLTATPSQPVAGGQGSWPLNNDPLRNA